MHDGDLSRYTHEHAYHAGNLAAERGTRTVMWITAATMAAEIAAGLWYNSMALLADGWHMGSHALAIGLSAFAYRAARRHATDARFAFGTWKIEVLGGFASAVLLLVVAAAMAAGSIERLMDPRPIHYPEAMVVAAAGLVVNLACAMVLARSDGHEHGHDHGHGHSHSHSHSHAHPHPHPHPHAHDHGAHRHDLNLRSAHAHVLSDAMTSVLALVALAGGRAFGWAWLDPAMGLVGAVLVALWAKNLLAETGNVLLDREMDHPIVDAVRRTVEAGLAEGEARIADLHAWRVGRHAYAVALMIVTHDASLTPLRVRALLASHPEVAHSTIEIHLCDGAGQNDHCAPHC